MSVFLQDVDSGVSSVLHIFLAKFGIQSGNLILQTLMFGLQAVSGSPVVSADVSPLKW